MNYGTPVTIDGKIYLEVLAQFVRYNSSWTVTIWDEAYSMDSLNYGIWRRIRIPLPEMAPLNEDEVIVDDQNVKP